MNRRKFLKFALYGGACALLGSYPVLIERNIRILIGGAGDYWEDELKIDKAFSCSDEKECRLLLSHNPDSVDTEFDTPLSLVISGHTHGGQVIIP